MIKQENAGLLIKIGRNGNKWL